MILSLQLKECHTEVGGLSHLQWYKKLSLYNRSDFEDQHNQTEKSMRGALLTMSTLRTKTVPALSP